MGTFKVEQRGLGGKSGLHASYPHTPQDNAQSMQDYLEDMLSQGWELVGLSETDHGSYWVFKGTGSKKK